MTVSVKDRVDLAFDAMNRNGIVAKNTYVNPNPRPDDDDDYDPTDDYGNGPTGFWCCGSCASYALDKEYPDLTGPWVFYHEQAAERLHKDGEGYLSHGPDAAAAKLIVKHLRDCGVDAEWSGDMRDNIHVKGAL